MSNKKKKKKIVIYKDYKNILNSYIYSFNQLQISAAQ